MSFLGKDGSWVNKVIFPAPKPSSYNADTFDPFGEACKLCYIPRKQAAVRRPADSDHDPNSVPCIWLPCSAPGASKILIYCHGNSEDIGHSAGMLAKIRDYLKCHVLGVEYPGYGMSEGSPSESGINNDLLVVYSFLTGVMKWPKTDIILYGFSIGTGPTTNLAAHNEVGGLVLLAPYTSIRDMVPEVLPSGLGKFAQFLISNRFDNAKEIRKVKCPALFIHGRSDDLIPHRHSETLYKNCGSERKELYLADTMKHCFDDDDLEAFVLFPVMGFFDLKGNKRTCTFPPYVFKKPPPKVEEKADGASSSASQPAPDGAPVEAKKEKEVDLGWNCGVCTYHNPSASGLCEMCGSPKTLAFASVDRDPPPSGSEAENKEAQPSLAVMHWSCPMCTLINPPTAKRCTVCGSKNASSSPPSSSHIGVADDRGPVDVGPSLSEPSRSTSALAMLANAIEHGSQVPSGSESPSKGPALSVQSDEDALAPLSSALPWECPVCTYVNPHSNLRCEICDRPSKS